MSTTGERIKYVRKKLGLNQTEFANSVGLSRNTISNVEINRTELSVIAKKYICDIFCISLDWLESGIGNPFSQSEEDLKIAALQLQIADDSKKANLVDKLFKLNDEEVDLINSLVDKLLKNKT